MPKEVFPILAKVSMYIIEIIKSMRRCNFDFSEHESLFSLQKDFAKVDLFFRERKYCYKANIKVCLIKFGQVSLEIDTPGLRCVHLKVENATLAEIKSFVGIYFKRVRRF